MSRVIVHPSARAEILQARDHFEAEWSGLGRDFLAEFEAAIGFLLEYPHLGKLERGRLRCWPLRRFPYMLIYAAQTQGVTFLRLHIRVVARVIGQAIKPARSRTL